MSSQISRATAIDIPLEFLHGMREAVIRIPLSEFRALGLEKFVSLCGEAGLRGITELVCTGPGGILAVQVEHPFQEKQLSALNYVEWWERVDQPDAGIVYLLKLTMPGLSETLVHNTN